jgi:hypothetical protein
MTNPTFKRRTHKSSNYRVSIHPPAAVNLSELVTPETQ